MTPLLWSSLCFNFDELFSTMTIFAHWREDRAEYLVVTILWTDDTPFWIFPCSSWDELPI